jgi:ribosome-associated protein
MEDLYFDRFMIPASELVEIFETSGGPGGQHANRSETAVRLRFQVAGSSLPEETQQRLMSRLGETVEVQSSESRSQFRNRALARQQLKEKLEAALKEKPKRRRTRPTRASKKRRVAGKRARGEIKRLREKPSPDD